MTFGKSRTVNLLQVWTLFLNARLSEFNFQTNSMKTAKSVREFYIMRAAEIINFKDIYAVGYSRCLVWW